MKLRGPGFATHPGQPLLLKKQKNKVVDPKRIIGKADPPPPKKNGF
jgi:hypothetical protein